LAAPLIFFSFFLARFSAEILASIDVIEESTRGRVGGSVSLTGAAEGGRGEEEEEDKVGKRRKKRKKNFIIIKRCF